MATEPMTTEPAEPIAPLSELEGAMQRLAEYRATEREILRAQSYQVGDGAKARALQRAPLLNVQQEIRRLEAVIARLRHRGSRVSYIR